MKIVGLEKSKTFKKINHVPDYKSERVKVCRSQMLNLFSQSYLSGSQIHLEVFQKCVSVQSEIFNQNFFICYCFTVASQKAFILKPVFNKRVNKVLKDTVFGNLNVVCILLIIVLFNSMILPRKQINTDSNKIQITTTKPHLSSLLL